MKKIFLTLISIGFVIISAVITLTTKNYEPTNQMNLKEKYPKKYSPSVDHSQFSILQKKFSSPQEATEACISCHNQRAAEVMKSNHWNWEREEYIEGRGIVYIGKKNAINSFCIGIEGNEQNCSNCL